jgi:hypothetical protein
MQNEDDWDSFERLQQAEMRSRVFHWRLFVLAIPAGIVTGLTLAWLIG